MSTPTLIQAAIDDAYKAAIVDAEHAAVNAIYQRFQSRQSDSNLRDDLIDLVGEAIDEAMLVAKGIERMNMVSVRARLSPRNFKGEPICQ